MCVGEDVEGGVNDPIGKLLNMVEAQKLPQKKLAHDLEVSQQYICDILHRRRDLTPAMTDKFSLYLGATEVLRLACHRAGARKQGWEV